MAPITMGTKDRPGGGGDATSSSFPEIMAASSVLGSRSSPSFIRPSCYYLGLMEKITTLLLSDIRATSVGLEDRALDQRNYSQDFKSNGIYLAKCCICDL